MTTLLRDLRSAIHFLRQSTAFTLGAVLRLALGIGASTGTQHVSALHLSSDYFSTLGAHPLFGRDFSREEDRDPSARVVSRSLATQRFMMTVVAVFAVLALALASVGIYGLSAFSVSQRTHELGIRMALGADATSVLGLALREGTRLATLGTAIGIAGAFALERAIAGALFGVQPGDGRILAVASIYLLVVAFLACYLPARRATKVDPMVALRYE